MTRSHPVWCAGGYHCTTEGGIGEHRSRPLGFPAAAGPAATVATLVQPVDQAVPVLEVRVPLDKARTVGQVRDLLNVLESTLRKELDR